MPSVNGKYTWKIVVLEWLTFECNYDQTDVRWELRNDRKRIRFRIFLTWYVLCMSIWKYISILSDDIIYTKFVYIFKNNFYDFSFYTESLTHITHQLFFTVIQEHSYVIFHLRLPLSSFNSFSWRKTSQQADLFSILFHGKNLQKAFAGLIFR